MKKLLICMASKLILEWLEACFGQYRLKTINFRWFWYLRRQFLIFHKISESFKASSSSNNPSNRQFYFSHNASLIASQALRHVDAVSEV